ncbi:MAG TPA: hypothetical protein VFZ24_07770 [Longimicrobiales bacterium]
MSAMAVFTWLAIVVLVAGSLAVFGWFLVDVVRLFGRRGRGARPQG